MLSAGRSRLETAPLTGLRLIITGRAYNVAWGQTRASRALPPRPHQQSFPSVPDFFFCLKSARMLESTRK
ncbi:hypothetical protein PoB_006262100 [Plakobranchus ocellatus]|uniref:Uncharacterized protein n=1 Tax=Plakobranchus ocellatus TaxID=259542 RepID=A0AAV4CW31_9GAST|nr:hypothetical protein PoB_006262100 [Plakobranchus ocellatus]